MSDISFSYKLSRHLLSSKHTKELKIFLFVIGTISEIIQQIWPFFFVYWYSKVVGFNSLKFVFNCISVFSSILVSNNTDIDLFIASSAL